MKTCYNCACDSVCDHNNNGWEICGNWQPIIVKCSECKSFRPCEEIIGATWTGFCEYGQFQTDDDFCSRGERKENETD